MSAKPIDEKAVFNIARQIDSPEARTVYLQQVCVDQPESLARILALLEVHEQEQSFLESPAVSVTTVEEPFVELVGTRIGPYKLLEEIGQGGMGVVYLAEQHEPVRRRVALKVIKPGMDSAQVIARFEAERQALSLMDHPNIARVLDSGSTESGLPYFVMELVKGQTITEYCDEHRLTPRQRLELFVPVCQAVQHAHQKGIIHRDLKPSNVLVTEYDERPVCKVIDFGVAKALNQPLTDETMFTRWGQVVGTLDYMSPEQAKVNQLDIDTRSDIYSLGVMLYVLLTGCTPFDRERFRSGAWEEVLRIIREEEPPRMSTRLSSSESLASFAASRQIDPKKLSAMMHGELDWIVLKCLEKDRNRRYETASGLALDVQRYLADEPVMARPPSAVYRMGKFARKYKAVMAVTVAALLMLLLGTTGLAISNSLIRREQAKTLAALADAGKAQNDAEEQSSIARSINDFLRHDLLEMADTRNQLSSLIPPDPNIRLATLLDRAASTVDERFNDQPIVHAEILNAIGEAYRAIGRYDDAVTILKPVRDQFQHLLGSEHDDTLNATAHLAMAYFQSNRLADAIRELEQVVQVRTKVLGAEHKNTLSAIDDLALAYDWAGRTDEAIELHERAIEQMTQVLGPDDPITLAAASNLAAAYMHKGRYQESVELNEKTVERAKQILGNEHPDTLTSMNNLATAYAFTRRFDRAVELFEELSDPITRLLGNQHPNRLTLLRSLASCYEDVGRHDDAIKLLKKILEDQESLPGTEQIKLLDKLATCYFKVWRLDDAFEITSKVLELKKEILGPDDPQTLDSLDKMGILLATQNNLAAAEPYVREALSKKRRVLGEEDNRTLSSLHNLGLLLSDQGRLDESEPLLREAVEKRRRILGDANRETLSSIISLGVVLQAKRKNSEAVALVAPIEAASRAAFPKGNAWPLGLLLRTLGKAQVGLGEFASAEAKLIESQPIFFQARGPANQDTVECTQAIFDLYTAWHAAEPDKGYDAKAAEWKAKLDPASDAAADPIKEKEK